MSSEIFHRLIKFEELFKDKTFKWLTIGFLIFSFVVIVSNCISFIDMKQIVLSDIFEVLRILQYYLIILNYFQAILQYHQYHN